MTAEPIAAPALPAEKPKQQVTAVERLPPREIRVVESSFEALDTAKFEQMQRVATAMASASLIPDHLVGKPWFDPQGRMGANELKATRAELGVEEFARAMQQAHQRTVANCFLVVEQAFRWGFSPFATAPETYAVGGKLATQGKLVAAVVNVRAGLVRRLAYAFEGEGDARTVVITGYFREDPETACVDRVQLKDVRTDNKMWKKDPDQKLIYTGVVHWARRYCPEVVLGIKTDEDIEQMHVPAEPSTPVSAPPVAELLALAAARETSEEEVTGRAPVSAPAAPAIAVAEEPPAPAPAEKDETGPEDAAGPEDATPDPPLPPSRITAAKARNLVVLADRSGLSEAQLNRHCFTEYECPVDEIPSSAEADVMKWIGETHRASSRRSR